MATRKLYNYSKDNDADKCTIYYKQVSENDNAIQCEIWGVGHFPLGIFPQTFPTPAIFPPEIESLGHSPVPAQFPYLLNESIHFFKPLSLFFYCIFPLFMLLSKLIFR